MRASVIAHASSVAAPIGIGDDVQVELDPAVVQWLHDAGLSAPWLATSAIVVANYGVFVLPVALVIIWSAGGRASTASRRKAVAVGCIAGILAFATGLVLEHVLGRPRPFVALGFVPLIAHAPDSSFPSDHTLIGVALIAPVAWSLRPGGLLLLIWALLVGAARVTAGLHYPSDILGSALLALGLDVLAQWMLTPVLGVLPPGARAWLEPGSAT